MAVITDDIVLDQVEHILGSGTGTLDFAVSDEQEYFTWHGVEDAEWSISGVGRVENDDEDRFIMYPQGEYFHCEISATTEEGNRGPVVCRSE
ncbi:hypothetical protein [Salinigranum halophilum]|uniref:hypothetical protein n=1 Tax=Salinigranum halophilum TaxID=2565931 RepID=UPI00115D878D|nr:hypothetical protein [Salinigranum halophilum]